MHSAKVLLLYISENSGHHCATLAIEKALHDLDNRVETLNINSFNYTNPILEKVINRAYMGVVRSRPEIWNYLYDNPDVLRKTQKLREIIHKFNTGKLKSLLDEFRPDVIVCTQAFPCGMMADYKKSLNLDIPLIGVLTDYAPHSYWIYNNVDKYIVPSEGTGKRLVDNGIELSRVEAFGIPIHPKFRKPNDKLKIFEKLSIKSSIPCILIMGGTQGLGPIKETVRLLDKSAVDLQMLIATGTNLRLYNWLMRRRFRKTVLAFSNASNIEDLMQISSLVITKPGGITTAEALAKGLPMLILRPLPGQEAMNTRFLLSEDVALMAESPQDVVVTLEELLRNKDRLKAMSYKARALSKPDSSLNIAKLILNLIAR